MPVHGELPVTPQWAIRIARDLPGHFVQQDPTVSAPRASWVSGQGSILHVWGLLRAWPGDVPPWACAPVRTSAARPCPGGGYRYPVAARTQASG